MRLRRPLSLKQKMRRASGCRNLLNCRTELSQKNQKGLIWISARIMGGRDPAVTTRLIRVCGCPGSALTCSAPKLSASGEYHQNGVDRGGCFHPGTVLTLVFVVFCWIFANQTICLPWLERIEAPRISNTHLHFSRKVMFCCCISDKSFFATRSQKQKSLAKWL